MLEVIHEKDGDEEDCLYLPGRRARMRYRWIESCEPATCQRLLRRGWRRFGRVFFRPACAACGECRSLRLEVDRFAPNRSMRRAEKRNRDLEIVLRPAAISGEHLELYHRYHADMAARRGWTEKGIEPLQYYQTFVAGRESFGFELAYLEKGKLVALALVDLLPAAISAVYCYYDPRCRNRSLGTFSILQHVALAKKRGVSRVYLGYWVAGNASMRYKANYLPHEILEGRPGLDEEPVWGSSEVHSGRSPDDGTVR